MIRKSSTNRPFQTHDLSTPGQFFGDKPGWIFDFLKTTLKKKINGA
jgi:hypothetical protein